jgi:hypothetical protein
LATLTVLEHRLVAFRGRCQTTADAFRWRFSRADLHHLLARLASNRPASASVVRAALNRTASTVFGGGRFRLPPPLFG